MSKSFAMVFPGQGSQSVGMLSELASQYSVVRDVFDEASSAFGEDLWSLVQHGSMEALSKTEITQPVMLAAGMAVWRVWEYVGAPKPALMAGHSLGEYTAFAASGALSLSDAVRIVARRGQLMRDAVPQGQGKMAAVIGLDDEQVIKICSAIAQGEEWVEAVNFNAPGQVVIAGYASSVDAAMGSLLDSGARKVAELPISVPCHSKLMKPASEGLKDFLATIDIQSPTIPVLGNVDAKSESDPERIREKLVRQLYSPVLWVATIKAMSEFGINAIFECGPSKVLCGLVKRIDRSLFLCALESSSGISEAKETAASLDQ